MPLDALDQKTLTSLPRLSEIYDAYGVQVNALSVNEVFALYERTGFLYPDKAARLLPHLGQVRENWRRMLSAGESLLYVLTSGDKKRGGRPWRFGGPRKTAGCHSTLSLKTIRMHRGR